VIRAIIFDLDNTLTDFMRMKDQAVEGAIDGMVDAGLASPRAEVKEKIYRIYQREGIEYQNVFDQFLQEELGRVDYKLLAAAIIGYRRSRDSFLVLYPHVHVTLVDLIRRGVKLAVISDAPALQAWLRLAQLKLETFFEHVVTFDDTGERKPSEVPFRKALSLLGVGPEEALMVGDWPERDVVGAAHLGIRTVFARYGDTFGTIDSGADFEIDDVLGLLSIVDHLNEGRPVSGSARVLPPRGAGQEGGA
jgi:putative hydrolase of the HAD superfamily